MDLLKELKEYFATTPTEQMQKDFEELEEWGRVGPYLSEYFDYKLCKIPEIEISNKSKNPEFSLDFCFIC